VESVNAHSDSTLPSPGAADDLVGVAVMLEALRVMGMGERSERRTITFEMPKYCFARQTWRVSSVR
jgi:Zn-dependent M28 family amino/carboxypeptidase